MMKYLPILLTLALLLGLYTGCGAKEPDISLFDEVCSADESLKKAKESNVVVMEGLRCTSGKAVWDAFFKAVSAGKSARVLCAHYYTLDPERVSPELYAREKDQYPKLFFYLVEYDGETYSVKVRLSDERELDYEDTFPYLLHFTGKAPRNAAYDTYDNYVLLDDPTATMEGIWAGIVSSQANAGYHHCILYQDITG